MIDDPDLWRAASLLLDRYGHDAALIAARRADASRANGNIDGCMVWN